MTNPKPNNLYALLQAVERKKKLEGTDDDAPVHNEDSTAPVKTTAPVDSIPPVETTAPVNSQPAPDLTAPVNYVSQPLQKTAGAKSTAPIKSTGAALLSSDSPHLRAPYEVIDSVLPTLRPAPAIVLLRLYRLSCGFHSWTCKVSIPRLATVCNISDSLVRRSIKELVRRGYVRKVHEDLDNPNQQERGIVYEIMLPRLATSKMAGGGKATAPVKTTAPVRTPPNKETHIKETTHKQPDHSASTVGNDNAARGVGVGSKFSIEECRRYAEHLRSTGQGINNPGGYATTIHRTGEADALIEKFLGGVSTDTVQADTSACPDCHGTGFWYPAGVEQGVAKCPHSKLTSAT